MQQRKMLRGKPTKQRHHMYDTRGKNHSCQQIRQNRNVTIIITVGHTVITPVTHTRLKQAQEQTRDT